jgi:hypothetical protein
MIVPIPTYITPPPLGPPRGFEPRTFSLPWRRSTPELWWQRCSGLTGTQDHPHARPCTQFHIWMIGRASWRTRTPNHCLQGSRVPGYTKEAQSGRKESNLRPPGPKPGVLPLDYAPMTARGGNTRRRICSTMDFARFRQCNTDAHRRMAMPYLHGRGGKNRTPGCGFGDRCVTTTPRPQGAMHLT